MQFQTMLFIVRVSVQRIKQTSMPQLVKSLKIQRNVSQGSSKFEVLRDGNRIQVKVM